jgi:hypothetical protein
MTFDLVVLVTDVREIDNSLFFVELQCKDNDQIWSVSKPYSTFQVLDTALRKQHVIEVELPKLQAGRADHKTSKRRRKQVQIYLDLILAVEGVAKSQHITRFFDHRSVTKAKRVNSAPEKPIVKQQVTSPRAVTLALNFVVKEENYDQDPIKFEQFLQYDFSVKHHSPIDMDDSLKKEREAVLHEIYESEIKYVEFTTLLWNMYVSPLMGNNDAYKRDEHDHHQVPREIAKKIFPPNLETIIELHTALSTILCQRYYPFLESGMYMMPIGDIFRQLCSLLDIYIPFLQKYEHCTNVVRKWRQKIPEFDKWLNRRKRHANSKGLDFGSLIIMPCQRLPRYLLLLQSLLKVTSDQFYDKSQIEMAIREIQSCIQRHNELIRTNSIKLRTYRIAKRLQIRDLGWNQRAILKEALVVIDQMTYHMYLFYDIFILENEKKSTKQKPVYDIYPLFDTNAQRFTNTSVLLNVHQEIFYIGFENQNIMTEWYEHLRQVIEDIQKRSDWEENLPTVYIDMMNPQSKNYFRNSLSIISEFAKKGPRLDSPRSPRRHM